MADKVRLVVGSSASKDFAIQERVSVLMGVLFLGPMLEDERIRQGLSVRRFAEALTELVVDGLANKGERPTSKPAQGDLP